MFRTITWFLIVSLLTLNMAWGVDDCAFSDPSGSGSGVAQPLDPAPVNTTSSIPSCNLWCAGWMSFAILPGSSVLLPDLLPSFEGGFGADLYFFLSATPPTRPPIG